MTSFDPSSRFRIQTSSRARSGTSLGSVFVDASWLMIVPVGREPGTSRGYCTANARAGTLAAGDGRRGWPPQPTVPPKAAPSPYVTAAAPNPMASCRAAAVTYGLGAAFGGTVG